MCNFWVSLLARETQRWGLESSEGLFSGVAGGWRWLSAGFPAGATGLTYKQPHLCRVCQDFVPFYRWSLFPLFIRLSAEGVFGMFWGLMTKAALTACLLIQMRIWEGWWGHHFWHSKRADMEADWGLGLYYLHPHWKALRFLLRGTRVSAAAFWCSPAAGICQSKTHFLPFPTNDTTLDPRSHRAQANQSKSGL